MMIILTQQIVAQIPIASTAIETCWRFFLRIVNNSFTSTNQNFNRFRMKNNQYESIFRQIIEF